MSLLRSFHRVNKLYTPHKSTALFGQVSALAPTFGSNVALCDRKGTLAKVFDTISRLPRCSGQSSDARVCKRVTMKPALFQHPAADCQILDTATVIKTLEKVETNI